MMVDTFLCLPSLYHFIISIRLNSLLTYSLFEQKKKYSYFSITVLISLSIGFFRKHPFEKHAFGSVFLLWSGWWETLRSLFFRPSRTVSRKNCCARDFAVRQAYRGSAPASTNPLWLLIHITLQLKKQTTSGLFFLLWSGWWESNPQPQLGKLMFYH